MKTGGKKNKDNKHLSLSLPVEDICVGFYTHCGTKAAAHLWLPFQNKTTIAEPVTEEWTGIFCV